jgi:stage V sporulation protein S
MIRPATTRAPPPTPSPSDSIFGASKARLEARRLFSIVQNPEHPSAGRPVTAQSQTSRSEEAGSMVPPESEILKVSATSKPSAVAGAIAGVMREKGRAEVQAIGAGAVNQAVKAIAIARGYLAPSGLDVVCIPSFTDVIINEEERTAIRLIVESR